MAKRSKNVDPQKVARAQAVNVMKNVQENIDSARTIETYEEQLTQAAKYFKKYFNRGIREVTPELATQYLIDRAAEHSQSTIDIDRTALQYMMKNDSRMLGLNEILPIIKADKIQPLTNRAYSFANIEELAAGTNERNAVAIIVAHNAGLRAHELFTIERTDERKPSDRPAREDKFSEREDQVRYIVTGKGNLVREISLDRAIAERLEALRLKTPITRTDRGVIYKNCKYDLSAGKSFSTVFTRIANRELGWSNGAHGLRHTYAQDRMKELLKVVPREDALEIISQEMGHFRSSITEVYLR
jgi:integrase